MEHYEILPSVDRTSEGSGDRVTSNAVMLAYRNWA